MNDDVKKQQSWPSGCSYYDFLWDISQVKRGKWDQTDEVTKFRVGDRVFYVWTLKVSFTSDLVRFSPRVF